jgi:ribosomal protein S18 acetylase RimI-like enzyme
LALKHGKEKGFTKIGLWVFAENTGAVVLYEKSGLEVIGREPVVEHPLARYKGEVFPMTGSL